MRRHVTILDDIKNRAEHEGMWPGMDTRYDLIKDRDYLLAAVEDLEAEIDILKFLLETKNEFLF